MVRTLAFLAWVCVEFGLGGNADFRWLWFIIGLILLGCGCWILLVGCEFGGFGGWWLVVVSYFSLIRLVR